MIPFVHHSNPPISTICGDHRAIRDLARQYKRHLARRCALAPAGSIPSRRDRGHQLNGPSNSPLRCDTERCFRPTLRRSRRRRRLCPSHQKSPRPPYANNHNAPTIHPRLAVYKAHRNTAGSPPSASNSTRHLSASGPAQLDYSNAEPKPKPRSARTDGTLRGLSPAGMPVVTTHRPIAIIGTAASCDLGNRDLGIPGVQR